MRFLSSLGSGPAIFILWAALVLWSRRTNKNRLFGTVLTVNLATAVLINLLFKMLFHRARPDILRLVDVSGYSFPSGHSIISAAFYGYLAYLSTVMTKKPWKTVIPILLGILVFLIGLSRIYLGVHYASDVAAGLAAGLGCTAGFIAITRRLLGRRQRY